ncbi:hypothetical protein [Sinorhizobium meliloti]|uniref:hypothetical protein n=1 Tax=Rhizobium meliloti TaxID=382 RepID=UPI00126834C2|nr:hypothetical protein [Sinorhizobium meliloti]
MNHNRSKKGIPVRFSLKLTDSKVPKPLCASPSRIDRILYDLKIASNDVWVLPLYRELVGALITNLRASSLRQSYLLNASISERSHIGLEGFGLHLVRKVRNSFAHGATSLDFDQELNVPPLASVIHLSSRITLLAQQAMLLALSEEALTLRVYHGVRTYVPWHGETLAAAARALHLMEPDHDEDQMRLWSEFDAEVRRELDFGFCGEWV